MFDPAPGRGVALFELAVYLGFVIYFLRVVRRAPVSVQRRMLPWGITANLFLLGVALASRWTSSPFPFDARTVTTVAIAYALFLGFRSAYRVFSRRLRSLRADSQAPPQFRIGLVVFLVSSLAVLYMLGTALNAPYPPGLVVDLGIVGLGWIFLPRLLALTQNAILRSTLRAGLILLSANIAVVALTDILWDVYYVEPAELPMVFVYALLNVPVHWGSEMIFDYLKIPSFYHPTPRHELVVIHAVRLAFLVIWWFFVGFVISIGRKRVSAARESN